MRDEVVNKPAIVYYGIIDEVRDKIPEGHDQSPALKLERESKSYCPIFGHWSIINVKDAKTEEKNNVGFVCGTEFEA